MEMIKERIDPAVIEECTRLSFNGGAFPEVVQRLSAAGVKRYVADLVRLEKTYYGASGETVQDRLPLTDAPPVPAYFNAGEVRAAVAAVQRGEIGYADFLRRVMAAGTASYLVFIDGRQVFYFGRQGEFHLERFPGQR